MRPSASAAIAKRIFFIAHSPFVSPFCRRSVASWRRSKDFSDDTKAWVTGQIVRWVNVISVEINLYKYGGQRNEEARWL